MVFVARTYPELFYGENMTLCFDSLKLTGSNGIIIHEEYFYGASLAHNPKFLQLFDCSHDSLGVQEVEISGIQGRIYYFIFKNRVSATSASIHALRAAENNPLRCFGGLNHVTIFEVASDEEDELERFYKVAMPPLLSQYLLHFGDTIPDSQSGEEALPSEPDDNADRSFLHSFHDPVDIAHPLFTHISTHFEIESDLTNTSPDKREPSSALRDFHPEPLRPETLIGKNALTWSTRCGTYGMGGPGFFGLKLKEKWLIIALWGAEDWIELDGQILADYFPDPTDALRDDEYETIKMRGRDIVTSKLVGSPIVECAINKHSLKIRFENGSILTIEESLESRKAFPGTNKPRKLTSADDLRKGVFLSPTNVLWV